MPDGENLGERPTIDIAAATGGWPDPWPNVAEIAAVLPTDRWTLVGGLMAQLHSIHHGLGIVRPTNDVDIVLHIETSRGVATQTAAALRSLGYELRPAVDPRDNTAHRFFRGASKIDLVASLLDEDAEDVVDVLLADHHAPRVTERLAGRDMVRIEGGTQALRRTINARLEVDPGTITTVSVPNVFGALILKAAAYKTDSRDPERHLRDAVALLACIDDPFAERERFTGSDRSRLLTLRARLAPEDVAWTVVAGQRRIDAETALEILTEED
ncbi:hypothetical protein [Aeromicrobium choanae]|uniref:Nucleotidyl transferase AbiEii toxin, Type IV TA system n=1 Tax=Aeromicrobium choanae TaxID=1736691 RepID=A0A1T4YUK3_9ACTN|nr:hypothetical protein [Aeromicrobium choanae]SKB05396.1 hypothetical protein SAMN06295964_0925 [Aeromicrobium choanae]